MRGPSTTGLAWSISGGTALVAVLGDPVRHSLSPAMHNAALRELGLDWAYLALPTPATHLATVLDALEAVGCRGLNVTLPHKQAAAALVAERGPLAERLGAVNTLVPRPAGGWLGANTDVEGFLVPLREGSRPRRALVLGCGGSARAVIAGLVELGVPRIGGRAGGRRGAPPSWRVAAPGPPPWKRWPGPPRRNRRTAPRPTATIPSRTGWRRPTWW